MDEKRKYWSLGKKGLSFLMCLPSRKADGLAQLRLKAQRTAASFVTLEAERSLGDWKVSSYYQLRTI